MFLYKFTGPPYCHNKPQAHTYYLYPLLTITSFSDLEMIKYAREDTHYLLFCYDKVRESIVQFAKDNDMDPKACMLEVLAKSKDISLRRYSKPQLKGNAYYNLMERNRAIMSDKKFEVLKAVYRWRDGVARQDDESPHFVLPN